MWVEVADLVDSPTLAAIQTCMDKAVRLRPGLILGVRCTKRSDLGKWTVVVRVDHEPDENPAIVKGTD